MLERKLTSWHLLLCWTPNTGKKRSADDSISRSLQPEERVMLNTRADSITITQFFLPLLAFSCYFLYLFLLLNKPYSHESLLPLKCSCLPSSSLPPFKIHLLNSGFSPFLCLCPLLFILFVRRTFIKGPSMPTVERYTHGRWGHEDGAAQTTWKLILPVEFLSNVQRCYLREQAPEEKDTKEMWVCLVSNPNG